MQFSSDNAGIGGNRGRATFAKGKKCEQSNLAQLCGFLSRMIDRVKSRTLNRQREGKWSEAKQCKIVMAG